jgi:hypothetical protein
MLAQYLRGRTTLLFFALLLLLILFPYLTGPVGRFLLTLLYIAIPVTGIYAVSGTRRHAIIAYILGLPAIAAALQMFYRPDAFSQPIAPISSALFYAYTTIVVYRSVMRAREVDIRTIYAVISVYLLIGLTWMSLYAMMEQFAQGSFSINARPQDPLHLGEFLYFSFVTLTTLGYGDIVPLTPAARSLAMLEAVTGVLFVATTIAGIVGIYSSQNASGKRTEP